MTTHHVPFRRFRGTRSPRVVIVGAGPAGAACALELRRLNAAEVLVLDRAVYPRRKVCGSGLSPMALAQLRQLEMLDALRDVHVEMKRLRAVGPSGIDVLLQGSKGAWVVPRAELDNRLVRAAMQRGAELREGTRVMEVLRGPDGSARGVRTREGEIEADLVVIANGSPSTFELDRQPRESIRTIVGWWQATLPDDAGSWSGTRAWVATTRGPSPSPTASSTSASRFPKATRVRATCGISSPRSSKSILDSVVGSAHQLGRWAGHPATVTTRIGKIVTSRSIFVGEAARLVCSGTVEGISFALESGRIAARTIARSFDVRHGFSGTAQQRYRVEVGTQMLPKFLAGEAFYRVMRSPTLRGRLSKLVAPRHVASGLAHFVGEQSKAA